MKTKTGRWFDVLGGFALVVYAPAAMVVFGARMLLARQRPRLVWIVPWAGLLVVGLLNVRSAAGQQLVLQSAGAVLAGILLVPTGRRSLLLGLVLGVAVTMLAGLAERELTRGLWMPYPAGAPLSDMRAGVSTVSGDDPSWFRNGVGLVQKDWLVPEGATRLTLSFEARSTTDVADWQWYTNSPATRQERLEADGVPFTRLSGLERAVVRRVRSGEPLAGRSVRVSVELRAPGSVGTEACGLEIRTFQPSFSECSDLALSTDWQRHELVVTFPEGAFGSTFEVALRQTATGSLDVRTLEVGVEADDGWRPVDVVEPAGVHVRFPFPGIHVFDQASLNLVPGPEWSRHEIKVDLPGGLRQVSGLLQVERGLVVELRDIELVAADGRTARASAGDRIDLWRGDPNIAGHGLATAGVTGMALAGHVGIAVAIALAVLAAVELTGSRTAFFADVLSAVLTVGRFVKWRAGGALIVIGVAAAAMVLAFGVGLEPLGRVAVLSDQNAVSRTEIWSSAADMLRSAPMSGVGDFPQAWLNMHGNASGTTPTHAHNLWLHMGAVHGLPGLLAAAWLAASLCLLAWRWDRLRALSAVLVVLVLNLLDMTLLSAGVLFPLIALLNVSKSESA